MYNGVIPLRSAARIPSAAITVPLSTSAFESIISRYFAHSLEFEYLSSKRTPVISSQSLAFFSHLFIYYRKNLFVLLL